MEKAYKLLAQQKQISNKKAKELIDSGVVYVGDKKIKIARALMNKDTKFRVEKIDKIEIIYEDKDIIAINKPPLLDSYKVVDSIKKDVKLIHRLDRETSGILLLAKNEEFLKKAIEEFRAKRVKKIYTAWVDGIFFEETLIDKPISTFKRAGKSFSKIDKRGKEAITIIRPILIQGKKSKVEIEIKTGRTHQIRVHLASIGYPIIGDEYYGSPTKSKRVLLHAKYISLLKYSFEAEEPKDILKYK